MEESPSHAPDRYPGWLGAGSENINDRIPLREIVAPPYSLGGYGISLWHTRTSPNHSSLHNNQASCSKTPTLSPIQPRRLLHPPAPSLPRQPLHPGTRLVPSKAAAIDHVRPLLSGDRDDPNCVLSQFPVLLPRVAWSILNCAQHSHPPNPERAETRSCPRRAHFDRARSASRRTARLPSRPFSVSC